MRFVVPSEARDLGVCRATIEAAQAKTKVPRFARDDKLDVSYLEHRLERGGDCACGFVGMYVAQKFGSSFRQDCINEHAGT